MKTAPNLASCAISISEGTGRRNVSLVGTNPFTGFFAATFLATGFFAASLVCDCLPFGDLAILDFVLTAIFAPLLHFD